MSLAAYFARQTETKAAYAQYNYAGAALELAQIRERLAMILSQHEPLASLKPRGEFARTGKAVRRRILRRPWEVAMTPYKHAVSSARRFGGTPEDYIALHNWFDETKGLTGNWTHRALRHHAAGIEQAIGIFGHSIRNSLGQDIPTKYLAEQHVTEDCGFIPTAERWLAPLAAHPEPWMLRVGSTVTVPLTPKE